MPRGGYRSGSGGISSWKHGKTKTIRVPIVLAERLTEIARVLDEGGQITVASSSFDLVTESKVLDLSGITVTHARGEIAVRLEDLVRLGYEIKPDTLAQMVQARIRRKSLG